eukprot:gene6571-7621_t
MDACNSQEDEVVGGVKPDHIETAGVYRTFYYDDIVERYRPENGVGGKKDGNTQKDKDFFTYPIDPSNIVRYLYDGHYYYAMNGYNSEAIALLSCHEIISRVVAVLMRIGNDKRVARMLGQGPCKEARKRALLLEHVDKFKIRFAYVQQVLEEFAGFLKSLVVKGVYWFNFGELNIFYDSKAGSKNNIKIVGFNDATLTKDEATPVSAEDEGEMVGRFGEMVKSMVPQHDDIPAVRELIFWCSNGYSRTFDSVLKELAKHRWTDHYAPDAHQYAQEEELFWFPEGGHLLPDAHQLPIQLPTGFEQLPNIFGYNEAGAIIEPMNGDDIAIDAHF